MSGVKHTPGPWFANREHPARQNDAQIIVCTDSNHPLAALSADGHITISARIANARLIAAAPELLEACGMALGLIKLQRDLIEQGKHTAAWNPAVEVLAAAIAKAEGRTA